MIALFDFLASISFKIMHNFIHTIFLYISLNIKRNRSSREAQFKKITIKTK